MRQCSLVWVKTLDVPGSDWRFLFVLIHTISSHRLRSSIPLNSTSVTYPLWHMKTRFTTNLYPHLESSSLPRSSPSVLPLPHQIQMKLG